MKKLLTTFALCLAIVIGASTWLSANSITVNHTWDAAGNVLTSLGTLLSGEDPTATGANSTGVMVVEHRYLSSGTKVADFQVKASAGFVHSLYCIGNDATAVAGTVKIFDSLTETGTELYSLTITATDYSHTPIYYPIDVVAATGIYLGFTTTTDVSCTVAYR